LYGNNCHLSIVYDVACTFSCEFVISCSHLLTFAIKIDTKEPGSCVARIGECFEPMQSESALYSPL
jgi:hypothetical protein